MERFSNPLTVWLIGLFLCAQLFSLTGAMNFMDLQYVDDLDLEEIVTVDPFVSSNLRSVDIVPPFQFVALVFSAIFCVLASDKVESGFPPSKALFSFELTRLWLVHRHLLL